MGVRARRFTCCLCVPSPALSCNENDAEHLDRDQPYPSSQKTKRMRTSFKHHQLRTMKSYFAINHNPDAKDLKQLAQKTGLTKRVLQVSRTRARGGGICGVRTWGGIPQWPWALEGPSTLRPPISLSFSVLFLHLFSLSLAVFQYFFFHSNFVFSPSSFVPQCFCFVSVCPSVLFVYTLSLFSFL